jgi:hypothetical protein
MTREFPKRKIFMSYRRVDFPDFVERIRDWFVGRYGRDSVFMDFDNIPPFSRFADRIREKVRECDVLVAIIGPRWLELLRERMSHPEEEDYVQIEIQQALELGKCIAPICIKGAGAPRSTDLPPHLRDMMKYNVAFLNSGRDFLDNIEIILDALEQQLAELEALQVVNQDIESVEPAGFNLREAFDRFEAADERGDYQAALHWLTQIRESGFAPRFYPLEDYEREIRDKLALQQQMEREYSFIRSMAERAEKRPEDRPRVWSALESFEQSYPGYDPDGLIAQLHPGEKVGRVGSVLGNANLIATGRASQAIDESLFDQLDSLDSTQAESLFDSENIAVPVESTETITLEQAQQLGILDLES